MISLLKQYTNNKGFQLTAFEMKDVGLIFIPKELETQLGYKNLSNTIIQSESFLEGLEYLVLEGNELAELKKILKVVNRIGYIHYPNDLKYFSVMAVLTESGLKKIFYLSRKPNIESFRSWVLDEVLLKIKEEKECPTKTFYLTGTFTNDIGFSITPIEMQGRGFLFLPKELEEQLGYINFSNFVRKSEFFGEGREYLILSGSNLLELKELLMGVTNSHSHINNLGNLSYLKKASFLLLLTESGLYSSIMSSRKPSAKAFQRWVTEEVLPSIRRTGGYQLFGEFSTIVDKKEQSALSMQVQNIAEQQKNITDRQQNIERFLQNLSEQQQILAEQQQNIGRFLQNLSEQQQSLVRQQQNMGQFLQNLAEQQRNIVKEHQTIQKEVGAIEQFLVQEEKENKQFRKYAVQGWDRMDTILSESIPHDIFEGYKKLKKFLDEITEMYNLSNWERKQYLSRLCQMHNIPLPEKAFGHKKESFLSLSEIALTLGVYSTKGKPHIRLVTALIQQLNLIKKEESKSKATSKKRQYPEGIVQTLKKWLEEHRFPKQIELCTSPDKVQRFYIQYSHDHMD